MRRMCACLQASVSPGDGGLVTVIGTGVLKMFKIADTALKPLPLNANRRDTLSFTCQAWLPLLDRAADSSMMAAGTVDTGKPATGTAAGSGVERERQLMGTADGEVLLFEVLLMQLVLNIGPWHAGIALCVRN
jgi:hypothetical protein